jgi:hypothetical protein
MIETLCVLASASGEELSVAVNRKQECVIQLGLSPNFLKIKGNGDNSVDQ